MLHTMHTGMNKKEGSMAIKLDMSKAYDRVEWRFLEAVMESMGFESRWIRLIMMCVTSVQYAVLVNGTPHGQITPSSSMITHTTMSGELTWVPTSKRGPRVSHLFLANNSLLFCRTSISQWVQLAKILHLYEEALG
jgi:hypothetical protein